MNEELLQMRKLFNITEKHIVEFLEYVPIKEKHMNVESPYIFNMIMESGPQVEPMMQKMVELIKPYQIPDTQDLFGECYEHLKSMLSIQKVVTRDEGIVLRPFSDSNPQWWKAYNNHIKHTLPKGMKKAILKNLLCIHASLFIMHNIVDIYKKYIVVPTYKLLNSQCWADYEDIFKKDPLRTADILSESGQVSKIFYNITIYKPILNIL